MNTHVKVLGIIFIVMGALGILMFLLMMFSCGALTAIIGSSPEAEAEAAAGFFAFFMSIMNFIFLAGGLLELITGIGLLKYKSWARILGIILCILNLFGFPIGTAIGIYGLWVLFNAEGTALFRS